MPVYTPREQNVIQRVLKDHFPDFEKNYDDHYADTYGTYRIIRIIVDYRNIVAKIGNLYHTILSQERKREEKTVGRKLCLNNELTSHITGYNNYYTPYSKRKLQL